jgi:hypothetical protein
MPLTNSCTLIHMPAYRCQLQRDDGPQLTRVFDCSNDTDFVMKAIRPQRERHRAFFVCWSAVKCHRRITSKWHFHRPTGAEFGDAPVMNDATKRSKCWEVPRGRRFGVKRVKDATVWDPALG